MNLNKKETTTHPYLFTSVFDRLLKETYNRIYLIDEKLKKRSRMRNIWRGYRKRHKKKATSATDTFSQYRNIRANLKSINPFNAKRLQD